MELACDDFEQLGVCIEEYWVYTRNNYCTKHIKNQKQFAAHVPKN
jgi:hypothetical protein